MTGSAFSSWLSECLSRQQRLEDQKLSLEERRKALIRRNNGGLTPHYYDAKRSADIQVARLKQDRTCHQHLEELEGFLPDVVDRPPDLFKGIANWTCNLNWMCCERKYWESQLLSRSFI